jgi:hypothetical protein
MLYFTSAVTIRQLLEIVPRKLMISTVQGKGRKGRNG